MGSLAEMLANRIIPYVTRNILDGVATAENVIVVTHFPELAVVILLESERSATFEFFHEAEKIRVNVDRMD